MIPSGVDSEERPAYDVLARKTVEILDIINCTRQLLIEKYNNDQNMWLEAMFRILMMNNSSFLLEEKFSVTEDFDVNRILKDQLFEMFRTTDKHNLSNIAPKSVASESSAPNSGSNHVETGCILIASFRIFTDFLLRTKLDLADELPNLQVIAKNIEKYDQRLNSEAEKLKFAVAEQKSDDGRNLLKNETAFFDSVDPEIGEILTSTISDSNDQTCDVCGDVMTIFNNDADFSLTLHEQKKKHKQAVRKKIKAIKKVMKNKSSLPLDEEKRIRSSVIDQVGTAQAKLFRLHSNEEFYCIVCKCPVWSLINLVSHVKNKVHSENCSIKDSMETKSEVESGSTTNTEADSAEETTIRVSMTPLPVKSLFDD